MTSIHGSAALGQLAALGQKNKTLGSLVEKAEKYTAENSVDAGRFKAALAAEKKIRRINVPKQKLRNILLTHRAKHCEKCENPKKFIWLDQRMNAPSPQRYRRFTMTLTRMVSATAANTG